MKKLSALFIALFLVIALFVTSCGLNPKKPVEPDSSSQSSSAESSSKEKPDEPDTERGRKHIKYIEDNAADLQQEAFKYKALLTLMFKSRLLKPEVAESYLAAAQDQGNTEITAAILQYQHLYTPGSAKDAMSRFEL